MIRPMTPFFAPDPGVGEKRLGPGHPHVLAGGREGNPAEQVEPREGLHCTGHDVGFSLFARGTLFSQS